MGVKIRIYFRGQSWGLHRTIKNKSSWRVQTSQGESSPDLVSRSICLLKFNRDFLVQTYICDQWLKCKIRGGETLHSGLGP